MKKNIIYSVIILFTLSFIAQAQNSNANNEEENKKIDINVGGRLIIDYAHYLNDKTDMSSGAKVTQMRVRLYGSYDSTFQYKLDADFADINMPIKDAFLRWLNKNQKHSFRIGYFVMPFSLDKVTSLLNLAFIARPGTSNALVLSRKMGIEYRFNHKNLWFGTGFFGNDPNKLKQGDDSWGLSSKIVYRNNLFNNNLIHLGVAASTRTPDPNNFENGSDEDNRYIEYISNNESNITNVNILDAKIENATGEYKFNTELLFMSKKFFLAGEYTIATVTRARNNEKLFKDQLGEPSSFQTLEAWEKYYGKDLRNITVHGFLTQFGVIVRGKGTYQYDYSNAMRNTNWKKGTIELAARYNYTNLNDIDGIFYNGTFYEPNKGVDPPNLNHSIAGGIMHSYTVGANYYFNNYCRAMLNYGYQTIDNYNLLDTYSQTIQARLLFTF